jgi:hypothetical protein
MLFADRPWVLYCLLEWFCESNLFWSVDSISGACVQWFRSFGTGVTGHGGEDPEQVVTFLAGEEPGLLDRRSCGWWLKIGHAHFTQLTPDSQAAKQPGLAVVGGFHSGNHRQFKVQAGFQVERVSPAARY